MTTESRLIGDVSIKNYQLLIPENCYLKINKFIGNEDNNYKGGFVIVDWNHIIPLVEKIKSLHFSFDITSPGSVSVQSKHYVSVYSDWPGGGCDEIFESDGEILIDLVFEAVLAFIEWYNANVK